MTTHTEELIKKFAHSKDVNELPSIIIALQEEDNVSSVLEFKNCFRALRNLAAHEPATIVSQLALAVNSNTTSLVFTGENGPVVIDIVQFTAWMFNMYTLTGNIAYLVFWKTLMRVIYPAVPDVREDLKGTLKFKNPSQGLVSGYEAYSKYVFANYQKMRTINVMNPYVLKTFKEKPSVFWKMAIPDMFDMVRCFIDGSVSLRDRENIEMFLALYKARSKE